MKYTFLALAALLCACAPSAADAPIVDQWRAVPVIVAPVAFGQERVGQLAYRGGLELSSSDVAFGGLSDLEVLDDGRVVAISDNGDWFEARLLLNQEGWLTGVADVRTAMMRGEDGRPFPNKEAGDSEDMTQLADGRYAVSFEQTQSIRIYDLNRDGPFGAATSGPRLRQVRRLPSNSGLEALATAADGSLIVGAEGGDEPTAPIWRAPLDARERVAPLTRYPLREGFSLTSLDHLPAGGFIALERFYAPVVGARARIARFSEDALDAGGEQIANVEELALLEPPMPLDNFEGMSAVRTPNGVTRIYIVSDNNFSRRQRTLLLAFDIIPPAN